VAVVGSGPGNPVKFYVTPASAVSVTAVSGATLTGANGTYPVDSAHDLFIGGRLNSAQPGSAPFNGEMVNETIFNQALTPAQIQQLFLTGKGLRGLDVNATEQQVFNGPVASFMVGDPNATTTGYTATIVWGDGHTSAGAVSITAGLLTVSGTNTYLQKGSYSVNVTINYPDGSNAVVTSTATVASALTASGIDVNAITARAFNSPVASFVDANASSASDFTASITWGDGHASAGIISLVDGVYVVSGANTYVTAGAYPINVTINDSDGSSATVASTATVRDLLTAHAINIDAVKGFAFTGAVATFNDIDLNLPPSPSFAATITWGDGHTSPGTISNVNGVFTVSGTNTYAVSGSYTLSVTVSDTDANNGTSTSAAVVRDALTASGIDVSATKAIVFNGFVASFTDIAPSGGAGATATITWGDGHVSAGTISLVGGVYMVRGTNTYGALGSFPISVTINDVDGDNATVTSTATVSNPLQATGIKVSIIVGKSFNGPVASFTDLGPSGGVGATAMITWGDGNVTAGTISFSGGVFTVAGTHTYNAVNTYPLSVTINDVDGNSATTTSTADVGLSGVVVGRQLFYHNSPRYDVTNATFPGFSDDNAIASDKSAYLPGTGTATFSNITSYTSGINGIMVDIAGTHPGVTASDFTFKVGNNSSPGSWATAPNPTAVTVRANAGASGSDRVELIWADSAIRDQWLEVVVAAIANTGLTVPDVFFFGNELADTGLSNTSSVAKVSTLDFSGVQTHGNSLSANIPITNVYDFDRDGKVGTTELGIVQANGTNNTTGLKFIAIGSNGPFAPTALPAALPAMNSGDAGIASALAATTTTSSTPINSNSKSGRIPPAVANRLGHVDVNHGPLASYFEHLAQEKTAKAKSILDKADKVAAALGLEDHVLASILARLELD
jgi:hypothetical protein